MAAMGCTAGVYMEDGLKRIDKQRLYDSCRLSSGKQKKARKNGERLGRALEMQLQRERAQPMLQVASSTASDYCFSWFLSGVRNPCAGL